MSREFWGNILHHILNRDVISSILSLLDNLKRCLSRKKQFVQNTVGCDMAKILNEFSAFFFFQIFSHVFLKADDVSDLTYLKKKSKLVFIYIYSKYLIAGGRKCGRKKKLGNSFSAWLLQRQLLPLFGRNVKVLSYPARHVPFMFASLVIHPDSKKYLLCNLCDSFH